VTEASTSAWNELQDLVSESIRAQRTWASTVLAATRSAARGERASTRSLGRTIGTEYADYVRDLTKINLEYAKAVRDLSTSSMDRLSRAVNRAADRAATDAETVVRAPDAPGTPIRRSTTKKSTSAKRPATKRSPARKASPSKRSATGTAAKKGSAG
jgi:hypothetical protein